MFRQPIRTRAVFAAAALIIAFMEAVPVEVRAAVTQVGTYSALTTALSSASDGDTVELSADIVITSQISITRGITLDGKGYTISVPRPGLTSAGIFDTGASTFGAMSINASGKNVTITDIAIKGGYSSTLGNAISISAGTVLLDQVLITQSRGSSGGGGLNIGSSAIVTMRDSVIYRNSARYGGGLLNSGRLVLLRTTLSENRSESSAGGGGAVENKSGGTMYVVNSTFANNQSTEIGGAINNYRGNLYVASSTFTGNVAYGSYGGGAIGQNGGSVTVVSSLFAFNYQRIGGSVTNPTSYELDDLDPFSGTPTVRYSVVHDSSTSFTGYQNTTYSGLADGSNDTLFAGGTTSKLTDGSGAEIGSATIFRPFLVQDGSVKSSPHKSGSPASNAGTNIRFESSGSTQQLAYYDRVAGTPSWVDIVGTPASGSEVTTDQTGNTRAATPWAGAIEETAANLVSLVVKTGLNGSVSGGSLFGDTYPSGSSVRLTALANSGYKFSKWVDGSGSDTSTSNPYVFTITSNTVLQPVFTAVGAGEFEVAYSANGATAGEPPPAQVATSAVAVASPGNLERTSYTFSEWNTQPNGSGTVYEPGDTYNSSQNVTFYAMWDRSASSPSTTVAPTTTSANSNSGGSSSPDTTVTNPGAPSTTVADAVTPRISRRDIRRLPTAGIYLSGSLTPGGKVRVRAINLTPLAVVDVFLASNPRLVGTSIADGAGTAVLEFTIPVNMVGLHTVAVVERASGSGAQSPLNIVPIELPETGVDLFGIGFAAILAILLGVTLARSSTRNRRRVNRPSERFKSCET